MKYYLVLLVAIGSFLIGRSTEKHNSTMIKLAACQAGVSLALHATNTQYEIDALGFQGVYSLMQQCETRDEVNK